MIGREEEALAGAVGANQKMASLPHDPGEEALCAPELSQTGGQVCTKATLAMTPSLAADLAILAAEIKAEHKEVEKAATSSIEHAVRCGKLLITAKAEVGHGKWNSWVTANLRFSVRCAQGYMKLARLDPAKAKRVAYLPLRQALKEVGSKRAREPALIAGADSQAQIETPILAPVVGAMDIDVEAEPKVASVTPCEETTSPPAAPPPQRADVEKIIDRATVAIGKWFGQIAASDRKHLADALCEVIAEYGVPQ